MLMIAKDESLWFVPCIFSRHVLSLCGALEDEEWEAIEGGFTWKGTLNGSKNHGNGSVVSVMRQCRCSQECFFYSRVVDMSQCLYNRK